MKKALILFFCFLANLYGAPKMPEPPSPQDIIDRFDVEKVKLFQHLTKMRSYDWIIFIREESQKDHLYLYDGASKKNLISYLPKIGLKNFRRHFIYYVESLEKSVLVTFWSHGAHGEELIIFDPSEQKAIYGLQSSWPMTIERKVDYLMIKTTEDANGSPQPPAEKITYWPKTPAAKESTAPNKE